MFFFFSSRRRHTRCALVTGVQTCALPICWAGATGYPQFLPSVYLRVARDGNGDGKIDIWTSEADALAFIANYFVDAGWRKDVPWGVHVAVPSNLDRNAIMNRPNAARCPRVFERHSMWKKMSTTRHIGLVPQDEGRLEEGSGG